MRGTPIMGVRDCFERTKIGMRLGSGSSRCAVRRRPRPGLCLIVTRRVSGCGQRGHVRPIPAFPPLGLRRTRHRLGDWSLPKCPAVQTGGEHALRLRATLPHQ